MHGVMTLHMGPRVDLTVSCDADGYVGARVLAQRAIPGMRIEEIEAADGFAVFGNIPDMAEKADAFKRAPFASTAPNPADLIDNGEHDEP